MPTTSSEGAALAPSAAGETASAGAPAEAANVLPVDYSSGARATNFRWVVLALVFFAITINYIDRMVIGILAPDLKKQYHISEEAYGYITSAFAMCYAIGQMVSGRWLDWIGTRVGYAIALAAWSVAAILHALARSATGFGIANMFRVRPRRSAMSSLWRSVSETMASIPSMRSSTRA